MRKVFQTGTKEEARVLMDSLRRFLSGSFFNSIQTMIKNKKSMVQALGFESQMVDGILTETQTIPEYSRELYAHPEPLAIRNR
jgi:flagellar biosynthesis/type III secretory pathway chaperone